MKHEIVANELCYLLMMKGKVLKPPFGFVTLIRGSFNAVSISEQTKQIDTKIS